VSLFYSVWQVYLQFCADFLILFQFVSVLIWFLRATAVPAVTAESSY